MDGVSSENILSWFRNSYSSLFFLRISNFSCFMACLRVISSSVSIELWPWNLSVDTFDAILSVRPISIDESLDSSSSSS